MSVFYNQRLCSVQIVQYSPVHRDTTSSLKDHRIALGIIFRYFQENIVIASRRIILDTYFASLFYIYME